MTTNHQELFQAKPKVLIVDDITANLALLQGILKQLDAHLISAASGEEALQKLNEHDISLAIIDIKMPGIDGIELVKIIKNSKHLVAFPIIFITAYVDNKNLIKECFELGAVDFIGKPFNKHVLLAKCRVFLDQFWQKKQIVHQARLLNMVQQSIIVTGLDGIIQFWNKGAEQMFGWKPEEAIGQSTLEITPSSVSKQDAYNIFEELKKGKTWSGEFELQKRDGTVFWAHVTNTPVTDHKGKLVGIIGVSHDISRRKKMEEALRESENLYRTLLNASPEGVMIFDMSGCIIDISNVTIELFGASNKNDFLGENILSFFSEKEAGKMKDIMEKALDEGVVQNIEVILEKKDQRPFFCEITASLVQDDDGSPKAYMAIFRDLSQKKIMEQQLIHKDRLVSLGEMASGIAHEIYQPLLSITLGVDNIISKIRQADLHSKQYIDKKSEKIFEDINRISHIIDHIRSFSKSENTQFHSSFNLNDSILNAVSMTREQCKQLGINVRLDLLKEPLKTEGNTYRFEQVMLNLLSNAKDAIVSKSKTERKAFDKSIVVRSYRDQDTIRVDVIDNGEGIRPEDMERLMQPFFTSKKDGKGTGLGLPVTRSIIKQFKGNIAVKSKLGEGSTFSITLPA